MYGLSTRQTDGIIKPTGILILCLLSLILFYDYNKN